MAFALKSDVDSYGFTSFWRIENFNIQPGNNFSITSPEFKIKKLKSKWYIEIEELDGYLAAYLFKVNNPMCWVINYSISVLKGTEWIVVEINKFRFRAGSDGYGTRILLDLQSLKDEQWIYLPNGSLTISFRVWCNKLKSESNQCLMISRLTNEKDLCHRPIEYFSNLKPSDLLSYPSSYEFYPKGKSVGVEVQTANQVQTKLTQTYTNDDFKDMADLFRLFKEKDFSFVTLRTSKRDFFVHKAVLCSKSPVFNAMFKRQMEENDCNLVDIDDVDSQTMASLVKFLHFQPLDDLKWEDAVTLYYAADKYQIDLLRKECVKYLKKELSVENVCDALLLADLHQDTDLMSFAEEYFCKHSKEILTSTHWKDFLFHTELVAQILYKFAEKM